jgi:hypothetical protein
VRSLESGEKVDLGRDAVAAWLSERIERGL